MVRISRQRLAASRPGQRLRGGARTTSGQSPEAVYGAAGLLGMVLFFGVYFSWISSREGGSASSSNLSGTTGSSSSRVLAGPAQLRHPQLHVPDKNTDQYDALATDILQTLDCVNLLNVTQARGGFHDDFENNNNNNNPPDRRLEEEQEEQFGMPTDDEQGIGGGKSNNKKEEENGGDPGNVPGFDDFGAMPDDDLNIMPTATAMHLFCLAAAEDVNTYADWQARIKCDASRHRKALLDLWNMARSSIADTELLKKILGMSYEGMYIIADQELYLWDPSSDSGLQYMVKHVNDKEKTVDDGGLYGLDHNLGPGRIFVDVGSGLGTTSMAMSLLYPGTRIISIEVASPNWLLQEMNWRCNADVLTNPPSSIILAGVGPAATQPSFAKYLWKPDQTTATRAWTPASDRSIFDIEIPVTLQSWHSLRALAEFQHVDVLNVDCGACEYNFIPALSDEEFDSIHTVMGGLHWGYIPYFKLPSSKRGRETHQRLCQHENFAKTAKECCDVPDLRVKSSYPGQVLMHDAPGIPKEGTVADVAGELCDDFASWAMEKHLHDVENDYGWFHLSSVAEGY